LKGQFMAEPFLSQISIFPFNWAPRSYSHCDGQTIAIGQNQALYSLLRANFGGDGRTTFALPDLRGRVPVHPGGLGVVSIGQKGGLEQVTLSFGEMAAHTHAVMATTTKGDSITPEGRILADSEPTKTEDTPLYCGANHLAALSDECLDAVGEGKSHNNIQPSLVINFCIALSGVYPSRT